MGHEIDKTKQMTGGEVLKARPLYGKYIQFQIIGKILLATNSLPSINGTDHGIWRRIQAIRFNRTFTAEEQGLNPPQVVLDQVASYKTEMDSIAQFVEQECSLEPETKYAASKLYEAYRHFCQAIGRKPQSTNAFKKALDKLTGVYQSHTSSGM